MRPVHDQGRFLLQVAAQDRATFMRSYIPIPAQQEDVTTLTVKLEHAPGTNLFWGQLTADKPGGARISVTGSGFLPNVVTAPDGRFAYALNSESPLDLRISGARVRSTEWTVDPADLGSYQSPKQIPAHSWQPAEIQIVPVIAPGGAPLGEKARAYAARISSDEQDSAPEWTETDYQPGGYFSAVLEAGEEYHLMVADGTRWGGADIDDLQDGQVCQVDLREPAAENLTIDVRCFSDESSLDFGTVNLYVETATDQGIPGPDFFLASQAVQATGLATFSGIPAGRYQARWHAGHLYGFLFNIPFEGSTPLTARLYARIGADHGLTTGGFAGEATVQGTVAVHGDVLGSARVSLGDQASGEVLFTTETTGQTGGVFQFTGVPAGVYEISVLGEAEDGGGLYQLGGPVPFAVDGPTVNVGQLELYGGRCALVAVFQADQAWTPVEEASLVTVTVTNGTDVLFQVETDTEGLAYLYGLPDAIVTIAVARAGHESSDPMIVDTTDWIEPPIFAFAIR